MVEPTMSVMPHMTSSHHETEETEGGFPCHNNAVTGTATTTTIQPPPPVVMPYSDNNDDNVHPPDQPSNNDNNVHQNNVMTMDFQYSDMEYAIESFYTIVQPGTSFFARRYIYLCCI
jgi:hypothetical protein